MKKLTYLISIALIVVLLHSCNNKDMNASEQNESYLEQNPTGEKVEVSLSLGGDLQVTTETEPLTRTTEDAPKTLYGIVVKYKETGASSSTDYKHYAEGLFDNTNDMKITLETGYIYAFYCQVVKEGLDRVYHLDSFYHYPFYSMWLENEFIIRNSSDSYSYSYSYSILSDYYFNRTHMQWGYSYSGYSGYYELNPRVEGMYYGEKIDYTPEANGKVEIKLQAAKKYGIKYIINPPSDGSILVKGPDIKKKLSSTNEQYTDSVPNRIMGTYMSGYYDSSFDSAEYTGDVYYYTDATCLNGKEYEHITDFTGDVYKKATIKITWNRANGAVREYSKEIVLKSSAITTVTISVSDNLGDSGFEIEIPEKETMSEGSQNITIEGGELVEEEVEPHE